MNLDNASIIERIPLGNQPLEAGCVSQKMLAIIEEQIQNHKKTLIFYNRRGSASAWVCRDCGFFEKCEKCDIAFSYHTFPKKSLLCHQCNARKNIFLECPNCRSHNISTVGVGIEEIARILHKNFVNSRIAILDSDHQEKTKNMFESVQNADIIIATSMAIFLNNSDIGAVIFPLFELNNSVPEYDFEESLYLHIMYWKKRNLPIFIQTFSPQNPILEALIFGNYRSFLDILKKERKQFSYPPFSDFVFIHVHNKQKSEVQKMIQGLVERIESLKNDDIFMAYDRDVWEKYHGEWMQKIILKGRGVSDILEHISSSIVRNRHIYVDWH